MRSHVSLLCVVAVLSSVPSTARASITAFWQQVTITPAAITNDPALANMQSWDLMVTASGNWASAGLRAELNPGFFFYKHPLGGLKRPSPAVIAGAPGLEFTTYVNTPNDNGLNNANTGLLGGFPGGVEEPWRHYRAGARYLLDLLGRSVCRSTGHIPDRPFDISLWTDP